MDSGVPVYLMRGLPGSGKSTKVRELFETELDCETYSTVSSDDIMYSRYGEFRSEKLAAVHAECFEFFCQTLEDPREGVVVDNTNISCWEWRGYCMVAKLLRRPVFLIDIQAKTLKDVATCWERQKWLDGSRMPAEVFDGMVGRYWREPALPRVFDTVRAHPIRS